MKAPNTEDDSLTQWLQSAPGRYLLDWEQRQFDEALSDLFGFHALQLGLPQLQALRGNRMAHRWCAIGSDLEGAIAQATDRAQQGPALALHSAALPFAQASLDLVVMPHTLEFSDDPPFALREAERVLVPEGRVVISGFNPASLWGLRQRQGRWLGRMGRGRLFLPERGQFIAYWRLREWLRLLGFEVESARFGAYRPALEDDRWLSRTAWMDRIGQRWWPILGAAYFVVAIKRVPGVRLIEPAWRGRRQTAATGATVMPLHGQTPRA